MNTIRLTQFSHGSGCGCKIAPAVLESILSHSGSGISDLRLVVGTESRDDAAVYQLGDGTCLISTVDFFTPIVDDPFLFGRIAAANALSDVYAMGGKPLLATAVLGWPVDKLDAALASRVVEGGRAACTEAGIPLAGGHSIDSPEPFFGLSVNGTVKNEHLLRNNTARAGDNLYLSKGLGTGILAAALKRGQIEERHEKVLLDSLCTINMMGEKLGAIEGVHAMTDVTGFGLLGHLAEMTEGSGLSARLDYQDIPLLEGAEFYASRFIFPDNTYRNWNALEKKTQGISGPSFITLCDPQTNGGLLISASSTAAPSLNELFKKFAPGIQAVPIGNMTEKGEAEIFVEEGR